MRITPAHHGDQTYAGLLAQDDLPEGWYLPSQFPGERDGDASNEIDAILSYNDHVVTDEQRQSHALSDENEALDGRERYLEHTETHTRVMIRLQRQTFAVPEGVRITGGRIILLSGNKVSQRDLLKPLGDPKKVPDFYKLVALQHGRLTQQGDRNPNATIAQINGVTLSTAQGWVTKARDRGLLPPGRRGAPGSAVRGRELIRSPSRAESRIDILSPNQREAGRSFRERPRRDTCTYTTLST